MTNKISYSAVVVILCVLAALFAGTSFCWAMHPIAGIVFFFVALLFLLGIATHKARK